MAAAPAFIPVAVSISSLSYQRRTLSCASSSIGILRIRGFSSYSATPPHSLSEWRAASPPPRCGPVVVACAPSSSPMNAARLSTRLFVSGLSFRTTEESLRNAFKSFGELMEVNLVMDRIANRPRGFAFLRYATEEESKKAIEGMHGKVQKQSLRAGVVDESGRSRQSGQNWRLFGDCDLLLQACRRKQRPYLASQ